MAKITIPQKKCQSLTLWSISQPHSGGRRSLLRCFANEQQMRRFLSRTFIGSTSSWLHIRSRPPHKHRTRVVKADETPVCVYMYITHDDVAPLNVSRLIITHPRTHTETRINRLNGDPAKLTHTALRSQLCAWGGGACECHTPCTSSCASTRMWVRAYMLASAWFFLEVYKPGTLSETEGVVNRASQHVRGC